MLYLRRSRWKTSQKNILKNVKKKTCNLKNDMLKLRRSRWQQKKSFKKMF